MMKSISLFAIAAFIFSITYAQNKERNDLLIANGRMPNMTIDKNSNIYIVYGSGDSIMYVSSKNGSAFTSPALIAVLPKLFASAMRGPQIAATANGLIVTACTANGNIFAYKKETGGKWSKAVKINDMNGVAKEALMALSADGPHAYAVWLGVRKPRGQNLYGAESADGGKTWSKDILVYASPAKTVCECCKPSVIMKGNTVYVMFRNLLNGNRDLYLIKSSNGGRSFGQAQKLGMGSWQLNACPMDGGGLALNNKGTPETVWQRKGEIYTAAPGMLEKEIGEGRSCTIETVNGKNVYAWTENGNVVVMNPRGMKKNLGKGSTPLIKALNNDEVMCVWENEKQIHASLLKL
ncbi:MAG TPA: sialidase family protein [Chitinophagaceae bacterium]